MLYRVFRAEFGSRGWGHPLYCPVKLTFEPIPTHPPAHLDNPVIDMVLPFAFWGIIAVASLEVWCRKKKWADRKFGIAF